MADARSEPIRRELHAWYTGTLYNRVERKGAIVIIGHRTHQDDLQGRLLAQQAAGGDRWTVVELKALSTSGDALWPENAGNSPPTRSMEASQTQPRHGGAFLCRRTVSMTRAPRCARARMGGPGKSFVYNDPAEFKRADDLVVRRPIAGKNHAD
jgi:hypothetical protein